MRNLADEEGDIDRFLKGEGMANEFDRSYGIDPRSKANIRANGRNVPDGIDWDALMNAGAKAKPKNELTPWGMAQPQQQTAQEFRNADRKNSGS